MKDGSAKVAGVSTLAVKEELRRLMAERGLPSLSRAVGVALGEWVLTRSGGVQNPADVQERVPVPYSVAGAEEALRLVARVPLRCLEYVIALGSSCIALALGRVGRFLRDEPRTPPGNLGVG